MPRFEAFKPEVKATSEVIEQGADIDAFELEDAGVDQEDVAEEGHTGYGGGNGHDTIGVEAERAHVTLTEQHGADFNLDDSEVAHDMYSFYGEPGKMDFNSDLMQCRSDTLWDRKRTKGTPILPAGESPNQILHAMTQHMAGHEFNYSVQDIAGSNVGARSRLVSTADFQAEYANKLVAQYGNLEEVNGNAYIPSGGGKFAPEDVGSVTEGMAEVLWGDIQREDPSAFNNFYWTVEHTRFASDFEAAKLQIGEFRLLDRAARSKKLAELAKTDKEARDELANLFNEGPTKRCLLARDVLRVVARRAAGGGKA